MSRTTMENDPPAVPTTVVVINRGADLAPRAAKTILALPPSRWRRALAAHPEWATLSTLRILLAVAHDELDSAARRSASLAKFVLSVLPSIPVPSDAHLLVTTIEGTAWKEYGNALRASGQQPRALTAANRAIRLFSKSDALIVDRAAATVLKAHTFHDLGRAAAALVLLDEAAAVFASAGEERRLLQTITLRGIFLFETKHFVPARDAFDCAFLIAERLGDRRELARLYNNRGHSALQLGDPVAAWDYFLQAATLFAEQGMTSELPRAQWGLARLMRSHTDASETVADLHRIYATFERRGMLVEAATVLLEIASILAADAAHRHQVRALCSRLVELFAQTHMPSDAIAALAHLRQETLADDDLLGSGIVEARNYFRQLRMHAAQPFVAGH